MKRLIFAAAVAAACMFAAACSPAYAATPPAFDDPVIAVAAPVSIAADDLFASDPIEIRATAREAETAPAADLIDFPIDYSAIRPAMFFGPTDHVTGRVVTPGGRTPRVLTG